MLFANVAPLLPPPLPVDLENSALFLDLDGTLARLEIAPEFVVPDPCRSALLQQLDHRLAGRLAIISGRPLGDVDSILENSVGSIAGIHGLERRDARGEVVRTRPHPGISRAQRRLSQFARNHPGCLVEFKGAALALHYRLAPNDQGAAAAVVTAVSEDTGLELQGGDMMFELRTPGPDKADAVREFMAEHPFRSSTPIYVGDDETDEAGFDLARRLGGYGVLVGARRPTMATRRLCSPSDVLAWLNDSLSRDREFDH